MKKSSLAKFLLSTMLLPTAIAGSCKAEGGPLRIFDFAIVAKYLQGRLDTTNEDLKNFNMVSKKAGESLKSNYLLDLTSYHTGDHKTSPKYGFIEPVEKRIERYFLDHNDSNMKGTIFISGGNLSLDSTPLIKKLFFGRFNDKIKEKIGIIKFDNILLNHEGLNKLNELHKLFPEINITTDTIFLSNEIFSLEDIQKFAEITSRNNMKFKNLMFKNVTSNDLNTVDLLLSELKFYGDARVGIHFLKDRYNNTLSQLLNKYSYRIEHVKFPEASVEIVEPLLNNIPIKKYTESFVYGICDYVEKSTQAPTTFKNIFIPACYIRKLEDINLDFRPLNSIKWFIFLDPKADLIESTEKEIEEYFKERSIKIDALFDKEKYIRSMRVSRSLLDENEDTNTKQQLAKKKLINQKLSDELKHISQKVEEIGGKFKIESPDKLENRLDILKTF